MTVNVQTAAPVMPRRRRRRLVMLALALVAVAVPVGCWYYLPLAEEQAIAEALAETERLDPNWRLEQILAARAAVPDAENGSLQVHRVIKAYGQPDIAIPNELDDARKTASVVPVDPRLLAALRTFVDKCPAALVEARKLRTMPRGRPPILYAADFISTMLDPLQQAREVCCLLYCDVMLRTAAGETAEAMHDCRAMLNAGRSIGEEPFAIAVLVRIACTHLTIDALERVLARGEPDEAALAELQAALEEELTAPVLLTALRGERAGQDQLLQMIRGGKIKSSYIAAMTGRRIHWFDRYVQDYAPAQTITGRAASLRRMNALVEAAKFPIQRQAAEFDRVATEWKDDTQTPLLPIGWLSDALKVHLQAQANLRCAVAGLAAERYRHKRGHWPDSLDALVQAGLLAAVPRDPYDGQPLRCKRLRDGLAIYSVGPDGRDDGGVIDRTDDAAPGTDVGFRLWDMAARH